MLFPEAVSKLSDLKPGQTADVFALLCGKKADVTKAGKPFFKCAFRDAGREAAVMVWSDSGHYADCENVLDEGRLLQTPRPIRGRQLRPAAQPG